MMEEDAISMRKVMYLKLLQIKVQHGKGENYTVTMKKGSSSRMEIGNHRLFLCMGVMSKTGNVVYIFFNTTSENKNLWSKAIKLRDNEEFTIDTVFAVLRPKIFTEKYNDDMPLVYTDGGIVIVNNSSNLQFVPIDNNIPEKK